VRAAGRAELVAALSALACGAEYPLVTRSSKNAAPSVAFVFPGQGNQWPAMGADAYYRLPAYRAEADRCARAFVEAGLPSPLPYLTGGQRQNLSRTEVQGAQFVHAVGLARQWRSQGILPDITIGHSLGEVAAAYVAETITVSDAVALVGARASVVDRLTGRYAMAVLGVGVDEAVSLIGETSGWLEVSAVNGPSSTVVSGEHDAVVGATRSAQQRGVFAHQLSVDYPGHTSALRPLRADLAALLPTSRFRDGPVKFVSSAFGSQVGSDVDPALYWYESLCSTVRFDQAVEAAQKCGADTFVELSAHPSLLYPLAELVDDESALIVGSGHRDQPITDVLSASIATVAAADPGYPWADALPGDVQPPLRGFPNAPMRAIHLWAAPQLPTAPDPASALTAVTEVWRHVPLPATSQTQRGIAIVSDDADPLTRQLADAVAAHDRCDLVSTDQAEILAVIAPVLDQCEVTAAGEQIASRPDAGLPDYAAVVGPRCRAVWLLTAGGERVDPGDPEVRPGQAALAAMHRSVGFEFPKQAFGSVDLPSRGLDAPTAAAVVDVLLGETAVTALRTNAGRYLRSFRECRTSAGELPPETWGNVVITGGSGAIGLRYAQHCLEHGAQKVILLSRNGLDAAVLDELTERHHAVVHAPPCDITDRATLAAVAAEYSGGGASLVIHTAGIATTRRHAELTGADVAAVCAAKVTGLALLADVWPLRTDCRILACSSVFGVWGGHGHAAYAASNRLLDVLAAQLRLKGLDCTAIRWGLWQDAGVVEADEITRTRRSGLIGMEAKAALEAGLGRYAGDPLIFAADFDRLRVLLQSQGTTMPFGAQADSDAAAAVNGFDARPLADVVRSALTRTLHLGDSLSIDPNASLIDLGLDSLLALDLRRRLRRAVGHSAPVAQLLGGITVSELIERLETKRD
jgi:mycobactin polyketide synthetase MbtD